MKISLSNKFYKKEAIEKAIGKFGGVCDCRILNDNFELELVPKIGSSKDIGMEFCNFVLGITKDEMLF